VQESVLEQASVAVRKNEAVTVEEVWRMRSIAHCVFPQSDADGSHANGTTVQYQMTVW
jgi:hypothetical protein